MIDTARKALLSAMQKGDAKAVLEAQKKIDRYESMLAQNKSQKDISALYKEFGDQ